MSKGATIILAILAVFGILFIGAMIIGATDDTPDGRYNYEYEIADSFVTKDGDTRNAPTGMEFVIVTIHVCNDRCSSGISTNTFTWQWYAYAKDVQYSESFYDVEHPLHKTVYVDKGSECVFAHVYEVPKGTLKSDITFTEHYTLSAKLKHDTSIVV